MIFFRIKFPIPKIRNNHVLQKRLYEDSQSKKRAGKRSRIVAARQFSVMVGKSHDHTVDRISSRSRRESPAAKRSSSLRDGCCGDADPRS